MGYKTELQSNNADLQTILNKVNALPEAGGGGGSVETCTVTISADGPVQTSNAYYTNASMTVETETMSGMDWMMGKTFTVAKGTLLATETTAPGWIIDGNISLIVKVVSTNTPITLFSIEGTGTITASM